MECNNCEQTQRQFFCAKCLQTHVRDLRLRMLHFATDRDDQVAKSIKALDTVHRSRTIRADVTACQTRLDELALGLARLRKDNEQKRDRLRQLRETFAARRQDLAAAKLIRHPHVQTIVREQQELQSILARARSGLVQELVEVFNVVEVGGRPPVGGKAGTKGEWTIGGLILPVPGDIRRYPPDHINAVITHTIHFLSLLTFYLGVKLPFEISWSGKKVGVGTPWIGAGKGGESGGWAKWSTKHALHLSALPAPAPVTNAETPQEIVSESVELSAPPQSKTSSSFATALAMLIYNVTYLAHTQSVDIPLSQAGDVLRNLWTVCCSVELGRRSHETKPHLSSPTPPSFPLEFQQLLQATSSNPRSPKLTRPKAKEPKIVEEEEGWDLVDDDFGA